jgi:cytochrome P450
MGASSLAAEITVGALDREPYAVLARLREEAPVAWVPALGGWLVTRHDLALAVMRDAETFTVEDDRFTTARVVGPSMLSLDGPEHDRHRAPFTPPLRARAIRGELQSAVTEECERLIDRLAGAGRCELRGDFAGPFAAGVMTRVLGLAPEEASTVRGWYGEIVAAVTALTAGEPMPEAGRQAYAALGARLREVMAGGDGPPDGEGCPGREPSAGACGAKGARGTSALEAGLGDAGSLLVAAAHATPPLHADAVVANAAVLLFGGVDTTEGMITNAALHLLGTPGVLKCVRAAPDRLEALIEESLRLEPAAAVIDRYATRDVELGGARIAGGDLVRVSITAAGRDPAVFADPDRLDLDRERPRRHLAFAQGPHVCIGVHLARLEARTALSRLLARLPRLRLDPSQSPAVRGLVFRKPEALWVRWD